MCDLCNLHKATKTLHIYNLCNKCNEALTSIIESTYKNMTEVLIEERIRKIKEENSKSLN